MKQKLKPIPKFKNEDEERDFWESHDSVDYIDWSKAEEVIFPNLKPSTKSISIRLPEWLLTRIKDMASKRDVAYQSLIKIFLAEKIEEELNHKRQLKAEQTFGMIRDRRQVYRVKKTR